LPTIKAVITDYIGTLTNVQYYTMGASMLKLYNALVDSGFQMDQQEFLDAYGVAHEKYRLVRFGECREVTNAVWVAEALRSLGFEVTAADPRMNAALDVFFQEYIDSLELRPYAEQLLRQSAETCKLGLVSNFTYAPVVFNSLKQLGISRYFDVVVVSGDCGWRKPHGQIFRDALRLLEVGTQEAVFIGDSPMEDIQGALAVGLRTVFVQSQFFGLKELEASGQKPNFVMADLEEISRRFAEITA
jgi:putative hydrolase of the HAD superfamily